MKTIIAIGGGEIGYPGKKNNTKKIDREIIKCSGKKRPRLLFIPTASSDWDGYIDAVKQYFGTELGCIVDVLKLINIKNTKKEIEEKILSSDIVYVGGGNTMMMLEVWKKNGVDKILKKAWENGVVMSGLSAGAICWFNFVSSDSKRFVDGKDTHELIKLKGMNWINAAFCPHYDVEEKRKGHLKEMMKNTSGVAIAADDCAAFIIQDDGCKVVTSKKSANVYKVFWKNDKFQHIALPVTKKITTLDDLIVNI